MTSFAENMSRKTASMQARAELGISASRFMFRMCEIVNDQRLTKAINIFWDDTGLRNPERTHNFNCHTPNELEVPEWLYVGGLIRPNSLFFAFDEATVSCHIAQDLSNDDFQEVSLVMSSPFDIRRATWRASVGDYEGVDDDQRTNLIPQDPSIARSNEDFGALTSAIEYGLVGGEFERVDLGL